MPRPRVLPSLIEGGTLAPACHHGSGNTKWPLPSVTVLMPPLVMPLSFQVISSNECPEMSPMVVPPTAVTQGSTAGHQTCAAPSGTPPLVPSSIEQTRKVMGSVAAVVATSKARLMALSWDALNDASGAFQLIETTDGAGSPARGTAAVWIALAHPASDQG